MKILNIHYQEGGSWGVTGRSLALALGRRVPVALVDPPPEEEERTEGFAEFRRSCPPVDPGGVTLNLGEWKKSGGLPGRRVVSCVVWETSRIPSVHLEKLRHLDRIWVPSRWQKKVMLRNGLDGGRIDVVPWGFDPAVFHPGEDSRPAARPFRFLFVGKWEERKGVEFLLEAFTREFQPAEPVELVLAAHNRYLRDFAPEAALRGWLGRAGAAEAAAGRIHCLPDLPTGGLAQAYRDADAFVLPTRAEGWGLPLLEAMATGLPCIATRYSGLTEFAAPDCVYCLKKSWLLERVKDPVFFDPALDWGGWARPRVSHLQRLMRRVYGRREEARKKGERACRAAHQAWTWDHAADKALRALERLAPAA